MIFQGPYASLNPRMTAAECVRAAGNPRVGSSSERRERVRDLLLP